MTLFRKCRHNLTVVFVEEYGKNLCVSFNKELFRMLYCCGLRVSEAIMLKSEDVDLATGVS